MIGLQEFFYSSFGARLIFCHNGEIKLKFWWSTSQSVVILRLLVTPAPLALLYATYSISFVVVSRKELSIPLPETRWPDNFNDCHYLVLSITSSGVALFFCRAGQANCSSSNRPQRSAAKQNKTKQTCFTYLWSWLQSQSRMKGFEFSSKSGKAKIGAFVSLFFSSWNASRAAWSRVMGSFFFGLPSKNRNKGKATQLYPSTKIR